MTPDEASIGAFVPGTDVEIEGRPGGPLAGLTFVPADDGCLDLNAPANQVREGGKIAREHLTGIGS